MKAILRHGRNDVSIFLKKFLYQKGSMRWRSILSKYPIITFNNFFYSRKQLLTQMLTIVFLVDFDTIVIYKKRLVTPYHEIAADTMTFLDILFLELSTFSLGMSDFFPLPYTRSSCGLTGTSRVKSFSSCQTVFLIIQMLLPNLSQRESMRVSLLIRVP